MLWDLAADLAKLSLFVACAYLILGAYARRRRPQWTEHLTKRRLAVLAVLTLAVGGIKLIEDVVAKESGPVDEAILWFVRDHVPSAVHGFFAVVTFSGSARFLVPVAVMAAVVLFVARRRFEALLVGASATTATLVVWGMKAIVGRARPALWEHQWYWGSSFPSGHTLSTAAFSTAAALCVARIWPRAGSLAMALAVLWTGGVALSRLVLGVHWPSDVLAAMCLGAFIPLL
ncbi:MAG: phosphatase PAP2 family protein, partial [Ilumatobacteraceae bacterium]|nr:phosphatase PAP2 family protein [Ilumatobacteraceae bacterium]